ncbi:39S ribosomal protein L32, mitochondrial [Chelonus insularis]|uniref:39S ribosomal protein L32, mitochondrial n=1 Tax=Chelonus insularis TaxID=460826 RepID=UPI00158D41BD|nr:39S ribosomal protein L32, mitochondrial [Chelonus insularis]
MARNIINRIDSFFSRIENVIEHFFNNKFPPAALCTVDLTSHQCLPKYHASSSKSLEDVLKDGILWAVPKRRRAVEDRWCRKFGIKGLVYKILEPKKDLLVCPTCGHNYEAGRICNHCYLRVKSETTEMQNTVIKTLGLEPVEKEVVVLYEDEKLTKTSEFWKGQRIIELPKKRPAWYHSNLLQPTTQEPSDSTDVKPTELA